MGIGYVITVPVRLLRSILYVRVLKTQLVVAFTFTIVDWATTAEEEVWALLILKDFHRD